MTIKVFEGEHLATFGIVGTGLVCLLYCWLTWRVVLRVPLDGKKYKADLRQEDLQDEASPVFLCLHLDLSYGKS